MTEGNSQNYEMAVGTSTVVESGVMEGESYYTTMQTANVTETVSQSNWSGEKPPDTGQLCRSCANTSDYLIPIYEGEGLEHQLEYKIQKHLPIQVSSTDTLPLQLCYQCASTLIAWDTMISSCLEAEKKLKAMLEAAEEGKTKESFEEENHVEEDNEVVDSDDEPLSTSKNKLLSEKMNAEPIKKKILSNEKKSEPITNEKTATETKEEEDKERSQPQQRKPGPPGNFYKLQENCVHCAALWGKSFELANHLFRYHSLNVYHCHHCDRVYAGSKDRFIQHVLRHLNGEDDFAPEKSQKPPEPKKVVTRQKRTDKPRDRYKYYTCHKCGKQFTQWTGLSYHLKHVHEGIKEHACDICGRKFALKAAREDHRRIHTGERPYVCPTCGKSFKAKASLYIHSKTHTDSFPYPCTYCPKRFRWRQQLLSHITTHTKEKKHFCEECGKGFGVKNDLTKHKTVHLKEKPFVCNTCGMAFGQKRYLKNHEKNRHYDED